MTNNLLKTDDIDLINQLDWMSIVSQISQYGHFELTKSEIKRHPFFKSHDEISNLIHIQDKIFSKLKEIEKKIPLTYKIPSPEASLTFCSSIQKNSILSIKQLNNVALSIEAYIELILILTDRELTHNHVEQDQLTALNKLFIKVFRPYVDDNGIFNSDKHPGILELNKKLFEVERRIRVELKQIINKLRVDDILQFSEHVIVNDRYTLPVKADHFNHKLGSTVSRSQSGGTVFIEPFAIRTFNNDRLEILSEIESAIYKICTQYTKTLAPFVKALAKIEHYLLTLDLNFSKAKYSSIKNFSRPTLTLRPEIQLKSFFHPLLENAVSNDFSLTKDSTGFAITGPNAGGKTLCLKSIALSIMFLHYGMYLPAAEAEIYPFQELFYFGNDGQSVNLGLSSFSYECSAYLNTIAEITSSSIVIIDEIFNSTSSKEASALAYSLIKFIKDNTSAKLILSTHHERLKLLLVKDQSFISGSMGHEPQSYLPTYKLNTGNPGSSMALEVFRHSGQPFAYSRSIYLEAKELLEQESTDLEQLMKLNAETQSQLQLDIIKYNLLIKTAKQREGAWEIEKQRLKEKELYLIKKKYDHLFNDYNQHISKTEDLKYEKNLKKKIEKINSELLAETSRPIDLTVTDNKQHDHDKDELIIGLYYNHTHSNNKGKLLILNERKKTALLLINKQKIWVPFETLSKCSNQPKALNASIKIQIHKENIDSQITIDGRGLRLNEFEPMVYKSIDDLRTGHLPYIEIIHGHGEGILKDWVFSFINSQEDLTISHHQGNLGASTIKLS